MSGEEMKRSLEVKDINFQKDIIIPEIYNLENIKLIQSCNYPEPPPNKVTELKKRNIQTVIKSIINKPNTLTQNNKKHTPKKPRKEIKHDARPYKQIYQNELQEPLFMDIDEHLGELIAISEQNLAPTCDRIKNALSKVNSHLKNKEAQQQKQKQVLRYLAFCNHKIEISKIKDNSNESNKQIENEKIPKRKSQMKKRAFSAKLIRSNFNSDLNTNQRYSRIFEKSTHNLKQKSTVSQHITKSKQLITMINSCLGEEETAFHKSISKMKKQWGQRGKVRQTLYRNPNTITSQTLNILIQKRMRSSSISRLDQQYFKKS